MGRGLSEIQKDILRLAVVNRDDPERKASTDLYYGQVYVDVFGWKVKHKYRRPLSEHPGGQNFDLDEIGRKHYDVVLASVSRAVRRLEERGLVVRMVGSTCHWAGLNLTDQGYILARELSVGSSPLARTTEPIDVTVGYGAVPPPTEPIATSAPMGWARGKVPSTQPIRAAS